MKFGLQLNPYVGRNPWETVQSAAEVLDASRFDSLWLYDHFLYEGGYGPHGHPYPEPVLECFATLAAVAATTQRIRLGQLVTAVPYRNPAMLAKIATTLDLISHGRLILGLGAGWHQREYEAYGYGAWPPAPERLRRLGEALEVILELWTESPASFEGEFYRLQDVRESTLPAQRPHPPILIGGNGERVTLRLVARHAQMCNVQGTPAEIERLLGILRVHCETAGRPYEEIVRTMYTTVLVAPTGAAAAAKAERFKDYYPRRGWLAGTPAQIVDALGEYVAAGIEYVIFRMPDWHELDGV